MSNDKVLLLGHSGFLGKAVSNQLTILDVPHTGISLSSGHDLRNPSILEKVIASESFTSIINCAAHVGGINYGQNNSKAIFVDNTLMNLNILSAASKYRIKLINPISNCAYPGHLQEYREKEFWNGQVHESVFAYATTRRQLVSGSMLYSQLENFPIINIATPNIFGPGDHLDPVRAHALGGMVYRMILAKRGNRATFEVWGTGKPIREWIYIDDVASALVKCLALNQSQSILNIGTSEGISIESLARQIQKLINFEGALIFDATKPDGAEKKIMIVEEAPKILDWRPMKIFDEGLLETVAWFEKVI
jgi:GDP-L-fucose synthase